MQNKAWYTDWIDVASKSDFEQNKVQLGNGLFYYYAVSDANSRNVTITFHDTAAHMPGLLIVDINRSSNLYLTGLLSGVTTIVKTTEGVASPTINGKVLTIPLNPWSSLMYFTNTGNITIS